MTEKTSLKIRFSNLAKANIPASIIIRLIKIDNSPWIILLTLMLQFHPFRLEYLPLS